MYRLPSSNWWGKKMVLPRANMVLLYGRAMEQKEWEGVSSALNRANPGVLCGRCCGMCESLDITSPWSLEMVDEGPPLCGVVRRREGTGDRPSSVVCFSEWFCFW